MKRFRSLAALAAISALALSACGNSDSGSDASADPSAAGSGGVTKIVVGASPVPHAEILKFVSENLAADAGIEIEAEIENKDIGFVETGQEAIVKLDAFPFTRYGTLTGHVATISGDAVEQPGGAGQPPRLIYTARIRLEKDAMNVDGKNVQISPGMVAAVEIKTGTRKLIEFVLSPLMRMGDEAGRER